MKKEKKNKSFSIKSILILIIPSSIILIYLFLVRQDILLSNKWIPMLEANQMLSSEYFNQAYMYCANYNDIRNEKFTFAIFILFILLFIIALIILIIYLLSKSKINKTLKEKNYNTIKKNTNDIIVSQFENNDIKRIEQEYNENLKNMIYEIFCNLQMASMNFDYETLKRLLTDELYNSYYTSLEVLRNKSKRNIFKGFEFINANFVEKLENNITIELKVKFYGYIVDIKNKEIIKGSKDEKITTTYILNLVKYNNKSSNWVISSKEKVNEN